MLLIYFVDLPLIVKLTQLYRLKRSTQSSMVALTNLCNFNLLLRITLTQTSTHSIFLMATTCECQSVDPVGNGHIVVCDSTGDIC